jgi:hypothetical protein
MPGLRDICRAKLATIPIAIISSSFSASRSSILAVPTNHFWYSSPLSFHLSPSPSPSPLFPFRIVIFSFTYQMRAEGTNVHEDGSL